MGLRVERNQGIGSRLSLSGILLLITSIAALITYLRMMDFTSKWSPQVQAMFWTLDIITFGVGLQQLWSAARPASSRGVIRRAMVSRVSLSREGILYLLIMLLLLLGSLLGRSNMLLLVFGMMAGPFVVGGWLTYAMLQSVVLRRIAPERVMVGDRFGVEIEIRNTSPFISCSAMRILDDLSHRQEWLRPLVVFLRVPPRKSLTSYYELALQHRGRYSLDPLFLSSRFPMGLVERSRVVSQPATILAYPRIGQLTSRWRQDMSQAVELVTMPRSRHGVYDDEFHRLREFRWGDNPRAIHWRTAARLNQLFVREYNQSRENDLSLVVDLWQPSNATPKQSQLVEEVLSLAATAVQDYRAHCRDATIEVAISGQTTFRWSGDLTGIEHLMDGLAEVEAGDAKTFPGLVSEVVRRATASSRILVISTRDEMPTDMMSGLGVDSRIRTYAFGRSGVHDYLTFPTQLASSDELLDDNDPRAEEDVTPRPSTEPAGESLQNHRTSLTGGSRS